MVVVNTNTIEGATVVEYKNLVTGEAYFGMGLLTSILYAIFSILGTRCKKVEDKIALAKQAAFDDMVKKAEEAGANAILNVRFLIRMTQVHVEGTAVVVE